MVAGVILFAIGMDCVDNIGSLDNWNNPSNWQNNGNYTWALLHENKSCSGGLMYNVTACNVPPMYNMPGSEDMDCEHDCCDYNCLVWQHTNHDASRMRVELGGLPPSACRKRAEDLVDPQGYDIDLDLADDADDPKAAAIELILAYENDNPASCELPDCPCPHSQKAVRDLETCQDAATHQRDCSNVIVFGESATGPICRCLIQLTDWSEANQKEGVQMAFQCDVIQPTLGSSSDVYERTCLGATRSWSFRIQLILWAKVYHYLFELSSGVSAFRCMRKRVARRGRNPRDEGACGARCVTCWTITGTILLFSFFFVEIFYTTKEVCPQEYYSVWHQTLCCLSHSRRLCQISLALLTIWLLVNAAVVESTIPGSPRRRRHSVPRIVHVETRRVTETTENCHTNNRGSAGCSLYFK
jgi:hypothetical protein